MSSSRKGASTAHLDHDALTRLPISTFSPTGTPLGSNSGEDDDDKAVAEPGVRSAVTTFVPQRLNASEEVFDGDESYDMLNKDDEPEASVAGDQSAQTEDEGQRQEKEGVLRVLNSLPPSASHSRAVSSSRGPASYLPNALLSSSWPTLPPRAAKLHRRRRKILIRVLKTWEGREQMLQLSHSFVLLLHSSLNFPTPKTYFQALLRPAGTLLTTTFPRTLRSATMQRIYTVGEGIDSLRRVILIARWITNGTQAAMDHWAKQNFSNSQRFKRQREQAQAALTGEEPDDNPADRDQNVEKFPWLQPQSIAPLDAVSTHGSGDKPARSLWQQIWTLSKIEFLSETLGTLGEACEVGAFLVGDGLFWRAVGVERLVQLATSSRSAASSSSSYSRIAKVLMLSRRRRRGIERLGIVFSLCSIVLSLLTLRWKRRQLRVDVRSAHRRILRANDKLGWASHLAGTQIPLDNAISHRKRDPASIVRSTSRGRPADPSHSPMLHLQPWGSDITRTIQDLDEHDDNGEEDAESSSDTSRDHVTHHHRSMSPGPLLKSSERSLLRAESDLRTARRGLRSNSWLTLAAWSDTLFLVYETLAPLTEKEGVEAWSGLISSTLRLSNLWSSLAPSRSTSL